jgi:hypothetical protein
VGCQGDQVLVLRRDQVRIQGRFSIGSRQSGRTRQKSQVDPALGFKEEPGLGSRWVQPSTQYRNKTKESCSLAIGFKEEPNIRIKVSSA